MESCPRGTPRRTTDLEGISDPDIRVTRTEIFGEEKRESRRPDKLEGDSRSRTETGWRATPGAEGGTESRENDDSEDSNGGSENPETAGQLETGPKTPTETPMRNEQRCHVPGGAWLTQVRLYLKLKLMPEWMRGGRELEGNEEG
ncbi:hypothetical protein NDU88_002124 [Pleurodeles waltl]|uniref:Uncharacterized protein n=1 Tax=Pleurodeles waltl TaxID=8319 RepID=A0AAV7P7V3_PLEWA|nr:hypothetical protein NDU88_002124 [Pleurodeles waltl]